MTRLIRAKVHPASREDRVERRGPDAFEVWVKAPAERGLANEAVIALLERETAARLRLLKGGRSSSKIFEVHSAH